MNSSRTKLQPVVAAFALAMIAVPALAGKQVQPEKITCEEFLSLDEEVQPVVVYWLQGNSGEVDAIDVEEYSTPVAYVVDECSQNKKATVWEKVKNWFHTHTTSPKEKEHQ